MLYRFEREIPVEAPVYDVLVAGGGPAGYSAAISAARLGARVLILESNGALGGMATNGFVTRMDTTTDGKRMIVGGIMKELIEKMYASGGFSNYYSFERFTCQRRKYTPFDPEIMKLLLDDMTAESGAEVRYFTQAVAADVDAEARRVKGVIAADVEGLHYFQARAFIDATGDGILSDLCGAPCLRAGTPETPGIMPPTLCALFSNIPWETIPMRDKSPAMHSAMFKKAMAEGFFSQEDRLVPGIARANADAGCMNAGHVFQMDALDAKSLSDGMRKGRRLVQEYAEYYRKYVPGFENLHLVATAPRMGVRESRRILGEATLTMDDYRARRKFPDQIGIYSKVVDMHPYDTSPEEYQRFTRETGESESLADGASYGLPYGMIVPKGYTNLWTAGRCASSDRLVNSAVRVQPASAILGQAAGVAAWQCCRDGLPAYGADVPAIQKTLRDTGAVLE